MDKGMANFEKISLVLMDVLGTTTSASFAKDTLFPYVVKNAEEFLKEKWEDKELKEAVKQLNEEELDLEAAVKCVKELTEAASQNAGLKAIQGMVYEKGYESGELKAHVFEDVPKQMESWSKSLKVGVFSSGSEQSQKQIFSKSEHGDLTKHITYYFDQAVGSNTSTDSYKKIAEEVALEPKAILFITDLLDEAKAAREAGFFAALIKREGNAELSEEAKDYPVVSSFLDISFNAAKRKIEETPAEVSAPKNSKKRVRS